MRSSVSRQGSLALRLILPLLLVLILGMATPRQAEACCGDGAVAAAGTNAATSGQTSTLLGEWATQFSNWASNFALLGQIITWIDTFTKTFTDNTTTLSAVVAGTQQAATEADVRIATGVAENAAQSASASATAQVAGRLTPPTDDNQQLCNVIATRQGPGASIWWYDATGSQTARMIEQRYRTPGSDGSGPQYAADERNLRCGNIPPGAPPANQVRTANPIDGYSAGCIPPAGEEALIDADIRYSTLNGLQVFEMPPLVTSTILGITVYTPTPTTLPQKLYVAAMNYCDFAAGPRPTPPRDKDLDSPEGLSQTAVFDHASALESAFVTQCTKRVADLTRPNCSDPVQLADTSVANVCIATKLACRAFVAGGGTLTPDIDCSKGLSPRQAEYISHMSCKISQYYTAAAGAGVNHGDMMDFSTLCDLSMTAWQAQQADKEAALVEAFRGLQNTGDAYAGAGAQASKTMRIRAPAPKLLPREDEEAALDLPSKKVAAKATGRASGVVSEGRPFDADSILPVSMAQ